MVSVGNCNKTKNHSAILEAMTMIPETVKIQYLHVGMEEQDYPEREQAAAHGVSCNVRFVGAQNDVREALWAADVYVMPSLYEGFGIAALEAISVGLPAVLYDCSGLRDLLEYFPSLRMVSNPKGLSDALLAIGKNTRQQQKAFAEQNYQIACDKFGADAGADQYWNLYHDLV